MAGKRVATAAVLAAAGGAFLPQADGAAAAEVRDPHGVAIVIGNRDYEEPGLSNVEFALRDARAFERYALDVLGYAPENVLVLENATRRQMFRAFGRPNDPPGGPSTVRFRVDPRGRSDLVVFYSGHGAPGVDDGRGYLLPVDVPARAAQDEGYPVEALYRKLGALAAAEGRSAKSVRVFLDACFSGMLPGRRQLFVDASPALPVAALPEGVGDGVTVLSAAGADQMANWDRKARHGLFTRHLLDALYGGADAADYGAPDGVVTAAEARAYLDDRMTWAAWDEYETEQTASLLGSAAAPLSSAPPGGFPQRISADPAEAEKALGLSRADWTAAQLGLGAAGFDPGPADGAANPRTRAAVSSWQAAEGYGATGYLTRAQADALAAAGREVLDRDAAAFAAARSADTVAAFEGYLASFPSGLHADEARRLRDAAHAAAVREQAARAERERDDTAFASARSANTVAAFEGYLASFPSGLHADEARRLRDAARAERERDDGAFASARRADTVAAFEEYLASFPSGLHADEARRLRVAAEERERGPSIGELFRDCPHCPEMVAVPAGRFTMGSPSSEEGRWDDEGPQREVTIGAKFAVGVHEVTRGEFARFVSATGRSTGDSCRTYEDGEWETRSGRSWRSPGFSQSDTHPVVCVSWDDAQAYASWLSRETGEEYRLLSEAEWEYVARAGTTTRYWWGNGIGSNRANCWGDLCGDSHARMAPVGSFGANGFGLRDVHGNVWEWVEDCWHGSYDDAPSNGDAWLKSGGGNCSGRVVRGGSWYYGPKDLRAAHRLRVVTWVRSYEIGFRVARTFTP